MSKSLALYIGGVASVAAGVALLIAGPKDVGLALLTSGCAELGVKIALPGTPA